jgi:transmembrane sensor
MSTISVQDLFRKYLDETINPDEFSQLCELVNGGADPAALEELLRASFSNPAYAAQGRDYDLKEVFASLLLRIEQGKAGKAAPAPVIPLYRRRWVAAAASVILLVCAGTFFWPGKGVIKSAPPLAKATPVIKNDVSPGHEGAILTLANGQEIVLDSARNGSIATQGTTKISKASNGRLDYSASNDQPAAILYNKLTTPRARTTNVILADGTGVWLNAASSIRYPTVFSGKERQVEITGEVYFEVAKNAAMPFVVKRAHSDEVIQVLGTNFNVSAYDDEDNMKATLLEGSVKVVRGRNSRLLSPGQQAIFGKGSDDFQVIDDANIDEVMAWRNGRFIFSNMDLQSIMRQLIRWYDVDVSYEGKIPEIRIGGIIHNDVYLSTVMEFLGENGVRYKIEGKKITILQ